jgi:hypothetical protein
MSNDNDDEKEEEMARGGPTLTDDFLDTPSFRQSLEGRKQQSTPEKNSPAFVLGDYRLPKLYLRNLFFY